MKNVGEVACSGTSAPPSPRLRASYVYIHPAVQDESPTIAKRAPDVTQKPPCTAYRQITTRGLPVRWAILRAVCKVSFALLFSSSKYEENATTVVAGSLALVFNPHPQALRFFLCGFQADTPACKSPCHDETALLLSLSLSLLRSLTIQFRTMKVDNALGSNIERSCVEIFKIPLVTVGS